MVFWVTCSRGLDAFSGLEIWARYFRNDEMELVEIERTVCDAVSIGSNKLVHFAVPLLK